MIKEFIVDDFVMTKNKKFALNLNIYRNANYFTLNLAKVNFKNNLYMNYPELLSIHANKVTISYKIIPHSKRLFDTMNVVSIVDKFVLDALVQSGAIPDDSYEYVSYGEIEVSKIQKNKCKKIVIKCLFS